MSKGKFSKIVGLELENFMSIKEAKLVFDDSNIINLKGYNDSGKSNIVRSLNVLLFDSYKRAQKNFIKHGEQYFRIKLHFDDGVTIVRDKYINGASLYEMYKDGELVFSTKVGSTLTQVKSVPLEIKEYLAMTETSEGSYLNSQSIYDKQFLIETTGSENVELLNGVLKLKETGLATTAIKNDINHLSSSINGTLADIEAIKISLSRYESLDEGFISLLSDLDEEYDTVESKYNLLYTLQELLDEKDKLVVNLPELELIDYSKYFDLEQLSILLGNVSEEVDLPVLNKIDYSLYLDLLDLGGMANSVSNYQVTSVETPTINFSLYSELKILENQLKDFSEIDSVYGYLIAEKEKLDMEVEEIESYALENNIAISKCENCGTLVQAVAGHVHL